MCCHNLKGIYLTALNSICLVEFYNLDEFLFAGVTHSHFVILSLTFCALQVKFHDFCFCSSSLTDTEHPIWPIQLYIDRYVLRFKLPPACMVIM